tara:strand:+ start:7248 stop:7469 length:222 start_codon:yes stop_codon:yes gene_type:complete
MRNLNQYRIKSVGIVTLGVTEYQMEYHYPDGGSQYIVYVYKKRALHERGITFSTDETFFAWLETQPKQQDLFK